MAYFNKAFIKFWNDLEKNNDRDWFKANKNLYDLEVKEPFENFIGDLIDRYKKDDPSVELEVKNSVFRIYRDVRFSKDKSPYKTHAAAIVSRDGRKERIQPGIYIMMSGKKMMVGGGIYSPDKEMLWRIRDKIHGDPKVFREVVDHKKFQDTFGVIQGEKNKIIPKEFRDNLEEAPEIANKQFYYMSELPASTVLRDDLLDIVWQVYSISKPIKKFLLEAVSD